MVGRPIAASPRPRDALSVMRVASRFGVWLALALALSCGDASAPDDAGGGAAGASGAGANGATQGVTSSASAAGGSAPEQQPTPAEGAGISDPPTTSLHDHHCAGVDWQRIHGWLLLAHAAPEVGDADELQRCVDRYAGWVTHDSDDAGVSRASVYAALAAAGQCDADRDYDGALMSGDLCRTVHSDLTADQCTDQMVALKSFGIATVAAVLAATADAHDSDVPLMGATLGHGSVKCGGDDRWKILSPEGYLDHYVAAYNAYKARSTDVPSCSKHIVVSVALYTGMDDPGVDGVTGGNGCWTYERISKTNAEWKICNYDGTVNHVDGVKWAYDDTSTNHITSTEIAGIHSCMNDVPGRGYVYMTNRGAGWPSRVTDGVKAHFAELYSAQSTIDDQLGLWTSAGTPGQPMVNFGEPTTGASTIHDVTADVCAKVGTTGWFGVYVYPEPLRGARMSAMVEALNACTH